MTALALLFLVVYALPLVWPAAPEGLLGAALVANLAIWLVFALDLAVRVALAENRVRWLARHPIDVLTVALPALRPLRVLRVFTAGHSLLTRRGGLVKTGQVVLLSASLLILIGALGVLDAERGDPDATIRSFGDALWWAMATVTTVGYGDLYPVTTAGRWVAAALMLLGISVLGVVTAGVAAWFVATTEGEQGATTAGPADAQAAEVAPAADPRALLAELMTAGVLTPAEVRRAESRLGPAGRRP